MIAHPDHTVNARNKLPVICLASGSPRRRELITLLGLPVETTATDIDETPQPQESADQLAVRLSEAKARAVPPPHRAEVIILASDTIVSLDGEPLGKPVDAAEARTMLTRLRDRTHVVYTAITLVPPLPDRAITALAASPVTMRAYSDDELAAYIASGDPFDKAGAYAIQHAGFSPVDRFEHCFANVMGLPLCHVVVALRRLGIQPPNDVPAACQAYLHYNCPVHQAILAGTA